MAVFFRTALVFILFSSGTAFAKTYDWNFPTGAKLRFELRSGKYDTVSYVYEDGTERVIGDGLVTAIPVPAHRDIQFPNIRSIQTDSFLENVPFTFRFHNGESLVFCSYTGSTEFVRHSHDVLDPREINDWKLGDMEGIRTYEMTERPSFQLGWRERLEIQEEKYSGHFISRAVPPKTPWWRKESFETYTWNFPNGSRVEFEIRGPGRDKIFFVDKMNDMKRDQISPRTQSITLLRLPSGPNAPKHFRHYESKANSPYINYSYMVGFENPTAAKEIKYEINERGDFVDDIDYLRRGSSIRAFGEITSDGTRELSYWFKIGRPMPVAIDWNEQLPGMQKRKLTSYEIEEIAKLIINPPHKKAVEIYLTELIRTMTDENFISLVSEQPWAVLSLLRNYFEFPIDRLYQIISISTDDELSKVAAIKILKEDADETRKARLATLLPCHIVMKNLGSIGKHKP